MANTSNLDRIEVREFFSLLNGKVEENKIQLIAAAMAEAIAKGGIKRVIASSEVPAYRLASLRKELRVTRPEIMRA